ncbi:MAG: hypothetical protein L6R35_005183 [Caloplaca aegaea]|nr:MAG: hypothetical protein L6R35_005183 [Caloplaca aegaea]
MSSARHILVTGATGKQGGALISALASKTTAAFQISALTRSKAGQSAQRLAQKENVSVVEGDYNNVPAIFQQIQQPLWGIFIVTNPFKGAKLEEEQGKAIVKAAFEANVKHIIFTATDRGGQEKSDKDPTYIPHFMSKYNVEQDIMQRAEESNGAVTWTFLRPVAFYENLTPDFFGKGWIAMWRLNGLDRKLQMISTTDIGKVAAEAFQNAESDEYRNKAISLAGDEISPNEAASIFKEETGKEIPSTFALVGRGLRIMLKEQLGIMLNWFISDGFGVDVKAVKKRYPFMTDFQVIKIEHPTRGDDTRAWGPPYAKHVRGKGTESPGESAYFLSVNRNKKSIGLSFAGQRGQEILHRLAKDCDVLVENYLPDTLKKYQMDFQSINKINPGLIYASITGYGQTGPYRKRAGYDVMVEAEMGLMHITGSRDGPPVKVGVAVTDLTTGLYTSNSILAALLARAKTGKGQHIDVALSDCQVASLSNIASSALISGQPDTGRWGTSHPSIVPYRSFKTRDGDVLLGGGNDRLFGILCDKLGKPEWKTDERFNTNSVRVANRITLEALIEAETRSKTTEEWLRLLDESGMPYAAVNDIQATLSHEHEVEHSTCGPMKLINTPVKYSHSEPSIRTAPPTLGQHTEEILTGILGMSDANVMELKTSGVVA